MTGQPTPCEKPVDLELDFLYSQEVTYQGKTYTENFYKCVETGLVFYECPEVNKWLVFLPPVKH